MAYSESSRMDNNEYPSSKDELASKAEERGAGPEEVSKLNNLPEQTYGGPTEVEEARGGANEEGDGSMENSSDSSQYRDKDNDR